MARSKDGLMIEGVSLDPASDTPLHRQLYISLREMILQGILPGDARMPSSRSLAESLGVSRFTAVTALDQLVAEGYLRTLHGSGTFVETISGSQAETIDKNTRDAPDLVPLIVDEILSRRAKALQWRNSISTNRRVDYLHMSAPDHRLFPAKVWAKLTHEVMSNMGAQVAYYRDSDDPSLLEQQIAAQVAVSRGIKCDPENVVTTLGAHHAVNLITDLLLDPEDIVAFEEPGMSAVRSIFQSHGCTVLPMAVDEFGSNPASLSPPSPKLAFVTAAKQQPLTIAMPVKRKLEILNWAKANGTIIVEDDLGSEFRYEGRPIPPLKAMDRDNQVIYIGAFSMSLLQTLRIGYLIMPKPLAAKCRRLLQVQFRAMPQISEQILARFIQDGHYTRHLHKARRTYAKRQEKLLDILHSKFSDTFDLPSVSSGFYNLCYFKDQSIDEAGVLMRCNDRGLGVEQLSYYFQHGRASQKALLIGFASSTENELEIGMSLLRECL